MIKKISIALVFVASLFIYNNNSLAQANKNTAYDFKGIQLGITLDEFKALPPPPIARNGVDKDFAACTNEKISGASITPPGEKESSLGAINCEYGRNEYTFRGSNTIRYYRSPIVIGSYNAMNATFKFIKKPNDAEPRLYEMEFEFTGNNFQSVADGLNDKFGMPKSLNGVVQNRMGGTFPSKTLIWENATSIITLEEKGSGLDKSRLTYELKSYKSFIRQSRANANKNSM